MLALDAFLFQAWVPAPIVPVVVQFPPSKTYPKYPQPVLQQASGARWYLEVTNAGVLQVGGRTLDPASAVRDLQLVDPTDLNAYRLILSAAVPPVIGTLQLPNISFGYHKDLPVWGPNGREWTIRVSNTGVLSVSSASSNWPVSPNLGIPTSTPLPRFQQPMPAIKSGSVGWKLTVTDSGIWGLDPDTESIQYLSNAFLWTQDDRMPFQITVTDDGILTVLDAPSNIPRLYEAVLVSPGGTFFTLVGNVVSGDIILSMTSTLFDAMNLRDEWPLVISQHGSYLYISDDRFPPPLPQMARRWGQRRRTPRRNA